MVLMKVRWKIKVEKLTIYERFLTRNLNCKVQGMRQLVVFSTILTMIRKRNIFIKGKKYYY